MGFTLDRRTTKDGILILGIPARVRVTMGIIALAIGLGALIPGSGGNPAGLGAGGIVLLIIVVLGLFYEERWTFDPGARSLSFKFGLVFAGKTMRVPFDSVESIEIEEFAKVRLTNSGEGAASEGMRGGSDPSASPGRDIPSLGEFARENSGGFSLKRLVEPKRQRRLVIYLNTAERLVVESAGRSKFDQLEALGQEAARIMEKNLTSSE